MWACDERKLLRLVILLFSFHTILLKWFVAVLFTKTFSKLAAASSEGASEGFFLQTESDFWRFLFLIELTFEEVLGIAIADTFMICITQAVAVYMTRILAEKKKNERRSQVVWAATNGSAIAGGKNSRTANDVVLMTEIISSLQEHEVKEQLDFKSSYDRILISFIFGLILVPILSLIVIGLFAVVTLWSYVAAKLFIVEREADFKATSTNASLRILDIVRGADVIAVSDTAYLEQSSVKEDGALLLKLQRRLSKINSILLFSTSLPTGFTLPLILVVVYYGFENIGEDPVETSFSTLAFLVILEEVHKAMLFQASNKDSLRKYNENRTLLEKWLDDMGLSDRNDYGDISRDIKLTPVDACLDIEVQTVSNTFADGPADEPNSSWAAGDIVLYNISIGYSSETSPTEADAVQDNLSSRLILQNKNIVFPFGMRTALIGESGSGKSSILKVIAGLLLPVQGNVNFGTLSIIPENFSKLRRRMGYCSQESLLFARSIRENVWYGHRDPVDDEVILNLLQRVGLGEWISSQPDGLDTKLDRGEGNVSGGQAQRLQLARLLCRDYVDLVLLDEACSALDSENRKSVLKCMKNFLRNKTCVWITHHSDVLEEMEEVVDLSKL